MEYDFRKRTGSSYDSNVSSYTRPPPTATSAAGASHPMYGQQPSLYPKIGGTGPHSAASNVRNPPFHQAPPPPSSCSPLPFPIIYIFSIIITHFDCSWGLTFGIWFAAGMGIRVAIKPEYRITPPVFVPFIGWIKLDAFFFLLLFSGFLLFTWAENLVDSEFCSLHYCHNWERFREVISTLISNLRGMF